MEHENAVLSAQFSPDGQRVVTVSRDKTTRLWDAAAANRRQAHEHGDSVNSAQFGPMVSGW
jgi:WD40 repeat protein